MHVPHDKNALCDSYIVNFIHDATEGYYERGKRTRKFTLMILYLWYMMITMMSMLFSVHLLLWRILIMITICLLFLMFMVMRILLILFVLLLKVIMREGNMVLCISIILSFPSLCWKSWSCPCFAFLILMLCAFMTCFFTRLLCIGSGLD